MKFIRTSVDLDEESLERFKEIYPQHGSLKWFFNKCLDIFVEKHNFNIIGVIEETVDEALIKGDND